MLWYIFALWNLIVFFVYGADKLKAVKKWWRIPESVLILLAFLLGGAGAMFGMVVFNHKTSKPKFRILVPIAALFNIALLCLDYSPFIKSFVLLF